MRKTCFKCKKSKSFSSFYKHKGMTDGLLGKCKECTKKDVSKRENSLKNDPKWVEKERKRGRGKYYRLIYKDKPRDLEASRIYCKLYRSRYPEKIKANIASQYMRKKGLQIHHWSYLPEHRKDVFYFNTEDHALAHRYVIYDKERFQYRTLEGVLLDSRVSHGDYLELIFGTKRNA